jgi:AbrB family looped-hinge helix DNA binding protein
MQINLDEVEYITETTLTIRGSRRRTTVPKEIVENFGLKDGDKIRWILFRDNTIVIVPKSIAVDARTASTNRLDN